MDANDAKSLDASKMNKEDVKQNIKAIRKAPIKTLRKLIENGAIDKDALISIAGENVTLKKSTVCKNYLFACDL